MKQLQSQRPASRWIFLGVSSILIHFFSITSYGEPQFNSPSNLASSLFDDNLTLQREIASDEKIPRGWTPKLKVSGNISFGSSDNVVGQQNGDTTTLGANINGGWNFRSDQHEWRNTFRFQGATSRTPNIPTYIKSTDELSVDSIYLFSLEDIPWLGPYVRVNAETQVFKGEDIRENVVTYSIARQGGEAREFTGQSLRLTDGFAPFNTKQSVGAFAKIINEEKQKLEARLGVGALQVNARNQLAIANNRATPVIEVRELESYEQAGFEAALTYSGRIDEKTSYHLGGEVLIPIVKNLEEGDDRSSLQLTNYEVLAKLTSKVYDWLSLDYEYRIRKQPQLIEKNQIQHLLLVNMSYSIF